MVDGRPTVRPVTAGTVVARREEPFPRARRGDERATGASRIRHGTTPTVGRVTDQLSTDRRALLIGPLPVAGGRGLEFGPLDRPLVPRDGGDVSYVDHLGTDDLRAKYADHAHVATEGICEIDFVLGEQPLADLVGPGWDYVVASHVVEHVPDLVGWLQEMERVLVRDGLLALALPDKRRTFDVQRPLTRPSDLVAAHLGGHVAPTPRQVAEHHLFAMRHGSSISWGRSVPWSELDHVHDLDYVMDRARRAALGDYVDVHCWVFTPESFLANLSLLAEAGLTSFRPIAPPVELADEFLVHLRAEATPATMPPDWDRCFATELGLLDATGTEPLDGASAATPTRAASPSPLGRPLELARRAVRRLRAWDAAR